MPETSNAVAPSTIDAINSLSDQFAHSIASLKAALTHKESISYSVTKILKQQLGGKEDASMEREISDTISKETGRPPMGVYVLTRTRPSISAALDTKTGGAGGYTVGTNVPADIIDLMRNKMMVFQLGAQVLTGLKGNVGLPYQVTGSTSSWVGQNPGTNVAESNATFGQ